MTAFALKSQMRLTRTTSLVNKSVAYFLLTLALYTVAPANSGVLVSNRSTNSIRWYDDNTGAFVGTFSVGGALSQPHQLAFGPDGNLYVTGDTQVFKINGTTGAFMSTFVPFGYGGISTSIGLTFASDGNLLVSSAGNSKVAKYDSATGTYMGDFVSSGSGGLNSPRGMKYGPDGNLYVTSSGNGQVLKYDGATGSFISIAASGNSGPEDVAFLSNGDLVVSNWSNSTVRRYNSGGVFQSVFASTNLSGPRGLHFDNLGNLLVGSELNNTIQRYDGLTGAYLGVWATGLGQPNFLTSFPVPETAPILSISVALALTLLARKRR